MKKTIVLITTIAIIFSSAALSYGASYTDVKSSNWAYAAVKAMSNKSIISGYPDGSFRPNNTVTYGEFIKMALIAATGEDEGNADTGHWASNYYDKALELKYFTAYDIDKSQLKFQITRAHMALIISAILGDVKIDGYDEIQKGIKDITYQTNYEYDITKAYATGILTGYTDNTFRPEQTLSRAESATVINRLVDESKRIYPEIESKTGTKVVIDGDTFTSYNVKLGYNGIVKIEKQSNGDVWVYSAVNYNSVTMYIDNKMRAGLHLADAGYLYHKDGYYIYNVYYTKASYNSLNPISLSGKIPSFTFEDGTMNLYKYTNVTL